MSKKNSFYQTTFRAAAADRQAAFLEQLFAKDKSLRKQFEKFIADYAGDEVPTVSFVDLDNVADEIREELTDLGFDDEVYTFFDQGDRSYVPQYEAAAEGAEAMLYQRVFEPYALRAEEFFKKENLLDGTKILLALYEGHNNVYEPGYDEENFIDDYNDLCRDLFLREVHGALPFFKKHENDTAALCQVLDLLTERLLFQRKNYREELYEDEFIDRNIVYDLSAFKPLLATLTKNPEAAAHWKNLISLHKL